MPISLIPGHRYALKDFEGDGCESPQFIQKGYSQQIQFIQKEPVSEGSTELRTISDGTTNEELIEVLLDRLNFMNAKFPCRENSIAVTHLETALLWLNRRTANRVARGVEGQHKA